jgi:hypothetical protein
MSLRFFRRIRTVPGLRVNLSKSGASVSIGTRGAWYTIGPRGRRITGRPCGNRPILDRDGEVTAGSSIVGRKPDRCARSPRRHGRGAGAAHFSAGRTAIGAAAGLVFAPQPREVARPPLGSLPHLHICISFALDICMKAKIDQLREVRTASAAHGMGGCQEGPARLPLAAQDGQGTLGRWWGSLGIGRPSAGFVARVLTAYGLESGCGLG